MPRFDGPTDPGAGVLRFWLRYRDGDIELRPGRTLLGRSAGCHVVLDDGLVSRRHAAITVTDVAAAIEDLGSVNGVYVNGERVGAPRALAAGDRIVIGKQELLVRLRPATADRDAASDARRTLADTASGREVVPLPESEAAAADTLEDQELATEIEATRKGEAIDLLGGLADKVLALGRGDEAERLLGTFLAGSMDAARRGATLDASFVEKASLYAVKLAGATRKGSWVDYAIELGMIARRPLPAPTVDRLYDVLRTVSAISLVRLREYVALLHSFQHRFGPAERFLAQRIEGLERIAALK